MSAFAGLKSIMRQIMSMHCHTPIVFWKRKSYSPMMSCAGISDGSVNLIRFFGSEKFHLSKIG